MKNLILKMLFGLSFFVLTVESMAASISGNITYSGSATGKVFVAAFTDPNFDSDAIPVQMDSPGAYIIPGLSDGVYYIASLMTESSEGNFKLTDPWGVYGTWGSLTPVTIAGGNAVTSIDITLVDGTVENPNPFYRPYMEPTQILQLSETTKEGTNPCLSTDGTFIYLYKHDYSGAPSAKVYKINPSTGEVIFIYYLSLQSLPNRICWIDQMTFHKGEFWATGGYGDPLGSGWIVGAFKIDITTSNSSHQLPENSGVFLEGGLASDGENLYVGISTMDKRGVVKFDPSIASGVPASPLIELEDFPRYLCYGNEYLWAATDSVIKIEPLAGNTVACYNLPPSAAELYLNGMFWSYDEEANTLNAYTLEVVGDANEMDISTPSMFHLSQNYPNLLTRQLQFPSAFLQPHL